MGKSPFPYTKYNIKNCNIFITPNLGAFSIKSIHNYLNKESKLKLIKLSDSHLYQYDNCPQFTEIELDSLCEYLNINDITNIYGLITDKYLNDKEHKSIPIILTNTTNIIILNWSYNHIHSVIIYNFLVWLFNHYGCNFSFHHNRDKKTAIISEIFYETIIDENPEPRKEVTGEQVGFRPLEGEFDVIKIKDYLLSIPNTYEYNTGIVIAIDKSDIGRDPGWIFPCIEFSKDYLCIWNNASFCTLQVRNFVEWLLSHYHCSAYDDYLGDWPYGVTVNHLYPPKYLLME